MELIVESSRDQRVLRWLVEQVGEREVANAVMRLAGQRRAYPSNVAKVLGLEPPATLALASETDARRHLAEIARFLGVG